MRSVVAIVTVEIYQYGQLGYRHVDMGVGVFLIVTQIMAVFHLDRKHNRYHYLAP